MVKAKANTNCSKIIEDHKKETAIYTKELKTLKEKQNKQDKLMSKQFDTKNQLNNMLNQALSSIKDSPEQQRQQNIDNLEDKYIKSQTNLQTAPVQLEEARKNYYVYKDGSQYYNTLLEKDLVSKANELSANISSKFNEETANAYTMNSYYNTDVINSKNTIELYEEYLNKNIKLEAELKESRGDILTNDRKTYYETDAIDSAKRWNKFLRIIYYILVFAYIVSIFVSPNEMSRIKQLGLVILLVLYPFLMDKMILDWFVTWYFEYYYDIYKKSAKNVYLTL